MKIITLKKLTNLSTEVAIHSIEFQNL